MMSDWDHDDCYGSRLLHDHGDGGKMIACWCRLPLVTLPSAREYRPHVRWAPVTDWLKQKKIKPEKFKSTLFVLTKTYFLSLTVVWMERNLEIKILMGNGECENLSSADNGEDIGMFVFGNIIKYSGEIFLRVLKCWISQNLFHFFLRFLGCGIEACFVKIHHKVLRLFLSSTTEIPLFSLFFLCND